MIKPTNCQPVLTDKLITSAEITLAAASGNGLPLFVDPEASYDVVSVRFYPTVNYVASQSTTVRVGKVGTPAKFTSIALGAAAVAVGGSIAVALNTTDKRLMPGEMLTVGWTQVAGQSGKGILVIRLRPHDQVNRSGKRPTAAQATH